MADAATEALDEQVYEISLAQRVIARFSLSPPVDLETVAKYYAEVEYCSIPARVDGVCLNLKRVGVRPTILINTKQPPLRKRFTLAHELGHVLIPWHRGSLYDDFSMSDDGMQLDRRAMEAEANRFASELLMPSAWVRRTLVSAESFGCAISTVQSCAGVSMIASAIRLIGMAPPNHIFAYCDSDGAVLNAGCSPGTLLDAPRRNEVLDAEYLERHTSDRDRIPVGLASLHWWRLTDAVPLSRSTEAGEWRVLLGEILDDLQYLYNDRERVRQSINGVIGATNGRMRANTPEQLLAALIQRFDRKISEGGVFLELSHHPKFRDFLAARVCELRGI